VPDEISAFRGREEAERNRDQVADVVKGPGTRRPDERFQFREGQFDRIEIKAIGRQEAEMDPDSFDCRAHRRCLWTARLSRTTTSPARRWFERSIQSGGWPGFGFIVSEVELRRLR
jgi:hypothetical protein